MCCADFLSVELCGIVFVLHIPIDGCSAVSCKPDRFIMFMSCVRVNFTLEFKSILGYAAVNFDWFRLIIYFMCEEKKTESINQWVLGGFSHQHVAVASCAINARSIMLRCIL